MIKDSSEDLNQIAKPQKILIVGAGKLGSKLVTDLSKDGHVVRVVENSLEKFSELSADLIESNSVSTMLGDYTDRHFWNQMNLNDIEILVAITESDSCNLYIAQIATHILRISKVFVLLSDANLADVYKSFDFKVISISDLFVSSVKSYISSEEEM